MKDIFWTADERFDRKKTVAVTDLRNLTTAMV